MKTIVAALLCGCVAVAAGAPQILLGVQKAKVRVASLDPVDADTPANTQLLKKKEKELEVPVSPIITYSALAHPAYVQRWKRDLQVAKVRTVHGLGPVAAETPASTGLLAPIVTEHKVAVPKMVFWI